MSTLSYDSVVGGGWQAGRSRYGVLAVVDGQLVYDPNAVAPARLLDGMTGPRREEMAPTVTHAYGDIELVRIRGRLGRAHWVILRAIRADGDDDVVAFQVRRGSRRVLGRQLQRCGYEVRTRRMWRAAFDRQYLGR